MPLIAKEKYASCTCLGSLGVVTTNKIDSMPRNQDMCNSYIFLLLSMAFLPGDNAVNYASVNEQLLV
jgi:hypothetical protein